MQSHHLSQFSNHFLAAAPAADPPPATRCCLLQFLGIDSFEILDLLVNILCQLNFGGSHSIINCLIVRRIPLHGALLSTDLTLIISSSPSNRSSAQVLSQLLHIREQLIYASLQIGVLVFQRLDSLNTHIIQVLTSIICL